MGLGLSCAAELRPRRYWTAHDPLQRVHDAAMSFIDTKKLGPFAAAASKGKMLRLQLHPAAEPMSFEVEETGALVASARTSGAGPGYHRFVVDLLDHIARELLIRWNWEPGESEEFGDATGYAHHRDFARLQDEMAGFLREISHTVIKHLKSGKARSLMLNLPPTYGAAVPEGVITPLGSWPTEFFEEAIKASDSDLHRYAVAFYPWWEDDLSARVWRNLGLASLWTHVQWRPPVDPGEKRVLRGAVEALDHARRLAPEMPLPETELAEARRLLETPLDTEAPPAPAGVGYRRGDWRWIFTGGWSLVAPGYFFDQLEDEGRTLFLGYGDREIWTSSWSMGGPATPVTRADLREIHEDGWLVEHHDLVGAARIERKQVEGAGWRWFATCQFRAPGALAVVTVVVKDEADLAWAKTVFESVRRGK